MIYRDLEREINDAAEQTLKDAAEFARTEALSTTKFKVSTGFKQATQFHPLSKTSGFILADKPYAIYLEEGNNQGGPYIYPRNAKALHFVANGKDVFAKKVRSHPGYWFMQDASDKLDNEIDTMFQNNLKD